MKIHGLHHVTAITANAKENLKFYTEVLGLRLVKKTVNQDDTSAYHLFYADKVGTPGTDITFFDWERAAPNQARTDAITRTLFRIDSQASLGYWRERFDSLKVAYADGSVSGRDALLFEDQEGQALALVEDGGAAFEGIAWEKPGIPTEHTIKGFYAVQLSTPFIGSIEPILIQALGWEKGETFTDSEGHENVVYNIDGGGPGKEVHVRELVDALNYPSSTAGSVHHVAFRVKDEAELRQWIAHMSELGIPNSHLVDRFYFKSLYFRISPGILFELATDGPGFDIDEALDDLGGHLSLPPFLEQHRKEIEANLKPLQ